MSVHQEKSILKKILSFKENSILPVTSHLHIREWLEWFLVNTIKCCISKSLHSMQYGKLNTCSTVTFNYQKIKGKKKKTQYLVDNLPK